jgi:hypothetical protein
LSPDTVYTVQATVRDYARETFLKSVALGQRQVERDAKLFGLTPALAGEEIDPYVNVVATAVNLQVQKAELARQSGAGDELIIGGDDRVGILNPTPIIGEVVLWAATIAVASYAVSMGRTIGQQESVKQAVAQVDHDTTETCLNVHGQVTKDYFSLSGTPRYSDKMRSSPFHKGCRTAILVIPASVLDDEVAKRMREEAEEQKKKPTPSSVIIKYRVSGKKVMEFRGGRWHTYRAFKTNFEARKAAASLNNARRS